MTKLVTVLMILVTFLLVAPVIEYGAVESTQQFFTAIGNAGAGAGGD